MSKNNITILLWLFKAKINTKGKAPLYLRVSYQSERKNVATGYLIEPERWDGAKYKVKGIQDDAKEINSYILDTKSRLMHIFNDMLKDSDVNLDRLFDKLLGRDTNQITLLEVIKHHNDDFYKRIGIDYTHSTFEKYDILRKKIELFIPEKYGKKDIRLRDVSHTFAVDFDYYLKHNDHNKHNTVVKYLINLKKVINMAVTNGWLDKSPFINIKSSYKDVERHYLTEQELAAIEEKHFRLERLELVRDMFLFQCYTGLAYSDMAELTSKDISPGIDGSNWIIIRRKKTDERSVIPLLPKPLALIEKYSTKSLDERLLPCYAIQKFNSYLHEIADVCGIKKNLTSHVGRRTFATTIALANGVSIETISKILGHSTTKITHQYAVVSDLKVSQEMNKLKDRL